MVFHTYILYSQLKDKYYIGHTANIDDRLFRHNNSGSKSTKKTNDWVLRYTKSFETRAEAMSFERFIKVKKSRQFIENLINSAG